MKALDSYIPERSKSTEPRTRPVSVRLEPEYIGMLDDLSEKHGVSRRAVIQALLVRESKV